MKHMWMIRTCEGIRFIKYAYEYSGHTFRFRECKGNKISTIAQDFESKGFEKKSSSLTEIKNT